MVSRLQPTETRLPTERLLSYGPWGKLPARIRILYVTTTGRTGLWLAESLTADQATQIELQEAVGVAVALSRLRDEVFDVLLVSHEPGELDALELVEGIRAGHPNQATIILGNQSEQEMAAHCYEVGADGYACVNTATTRGLIWMVARAIEHHRLIAENQKLKNASQFRLQQDHQEVSLLMQQQKALISSVDIVHSDDVANDAVANDNNSPCPDRTSQLSFISNQSDDISIDRLPQTLINHYRELLRAYVMMGSGNMAEEMQTLANLLVSAGVTAQQTMTLHLDVLSSLVQGLGSRSARHVMNRADVLVLDVLIHLVEGYREQYFEQCYPPRQKCLPGFEDVIWCEQKEVIPQDDPTVTNEPYRLCNSDFQNQ